MRNWRMMLRLILRSLWVRRANSLVALIALLVATAVGAALMNLYVDTQTKLRSEFRGYGANLVINKSDGRSFTESELKQIESLVGTHGTLAPYSFTIAHDRSTNSPVVVVGLEPPRSKAVNSWWHLEQWPNPGEAVLGSRAAQVLGGNQLELESKGKSMHVRPVAVLHTGGEEDSRVYITQSDFYTWLQGSPSVIEVAATGSSSEIEQLANSIDHDVPGAQARPLRQLVESEANVITKTNRALLSSMVIILTTALLCVFATLMGSVLERRKDFAVMKALGASQRSANLLFVLEALTLGIVGAALGSLLGIGIAVWIGRANFHQPVGIQWSVLPVVMAAGVGLALAATGIPIAVLRKLEPAVILKGE